jgi:hypothetical protein
MTAEDICEMYDNEPNLTLAELSRRTGLTVGELKQILLEMK